MFAYAIFRGEFCPQISAMVDVLEKRLLPAFHDIDKEAETVSNDKWERFMSRPGTGEEDPADLAEAAEQAGISHYILLQGIRQGMLNLFAAALYHLFEQQAILFLRKELLCSAEEEKPQLFRIEEFKKRMKERGIDVEGFSSWPKVDEVRLVANSVKHAEGSSTRALHEKRPDLFKHPDLGSIQPSFAAPATPVRLPLAGEDVYVSLDDIRQYRDALMEFWRELERQLKRA